jgi:hypothetical protein
MGILFGLNSWKEDVEALIRHGKLLEKEYGVPPYIIGLPRFRKAQLTEEVHRFIVPVSDEEYKCACRMYKEEFPQAMLFINTREELELNLDICSANDLFTIDCGTYPGAYLSPSVFRQEIEQFHTYQYDREAALQKIIEKGFTPLFGW